VTRAVVVPEAGSAAEVWDLELPDVGPEDVRVKIAAAGVCHSDLTIAAGKMGAEFPLVLGHEATGTVVEVGTGVSTVKPGEIVVMNWSPACDRCWFCLNDEPWLCSVSSGVASVQRGKTPDGRAVHVAMGVGAFAEEMVLPAKATVPLPAGVPLDQGALMGCAFLTGHGAVRHTADVRSGESVLVVGLGGVGLSAVIAANLCGAGPIIGVDVTAEKEGLARSLGATHFLDFHEKLGRDVRKLTEGRGADHALECVGAPATIRTAWSSTRRGGHCTVVGAGGQDQEVVFNAAALFHSARTLSSSIYGSSDPRHDIPVFGELMRLGRLDLGGLITDRIDLAGVPAAFDRMQRGQGGRSLIEVNRDLLGQAPGQSAEPEGGLA
jgi:S-(hydroxymethyl)glutathione dehydrogenase/alcohol dehydrogenase